MEDNGIPILNHHTKGVREGFKLQQKLMLTLHNKKPISDEEIAWLKHVVDDNSVSEYLTLILSSWIRVGMVRAKEFEKALLFTEEMLIKHPSLHLTKIYTKMATDHLALRGL